MKNQSDLIVTIVAVVCLLVGVGVCFGTKREAVKPTPPEKVVTTSLAFPSGDVVMAASLPGGGRGAAMPAGAGRAAGFGNGARSSFGQGGMGGGAPSTPSIGGDLGATPKYGRPGTAKSG